MKTKEPIPLWDDIVFQNRNKLFGAYELRKNYNSRLTRSLLILLSGISLIIVFLFFTNTVAIDHPQLNVTDSVVFSTFIVPEAIVQAKPKLAMPVAIPSGKPIDNIYIAVIDSAAANKPADTMMLAANVNPSAGNNPASQPLGGNVTGKNPETFTDTFSSAFVDKIPEYPGGMNRFYRFISDNIRFTDEARVGKLKMNVFIRFVVNQSGQISDIRILNKVGYGLDERIMTTLSTSMQWSPGMVRNKPVNTEMILPLSFNIIQ